MIYSDTTILTKFRLLKFDVNLFSVEDVAENKVQADEIEGIDEGGPLRGCYHGMDTIIDKFRKTDIAQYNSQ